VAVTLNPTRLLSRRNQTTQTQAEPEPTIPVVRTPQNEQQRLQAEIARIDAEQVELGAKSRPLLKKRDELEQVLRGDDGGAGATQNGSVDLADRRVAAQRQLEEDRPTLVEYGKLSVALSVRRTGIARQLETAVEQTSNTRASIRVRERTIAQKTAEIEKTEGLLRHFRGELASYQRDVDDLKVTLRRLVGEEG
jgi:chromosome segregation ATPase